MSIHIAKEHRTKLYAVARETVVLVIVLLIAKYFMHTVRLDIIPFTSLITSLISSATFIIGFLLSGLIADFKESEKIPAEMANNLESMWIDGKLFAKANSAFNLTLYEKRIHAVVTQFQNDVHIKNTVHTLEGSFEALNSLSESFYEMEQLGNPPNYIVKLKTEQANIRRLLNRVAYIQRIQYIPSANILVKSITVMVLATFLFLNSEAQVTEYIVYGFIAYLFIYVNKLITIVEEPFQEGAGKLDDVSMFLLEELKRKVEQGMP